MLPQHGTVALPRELHFLRDNLAAGFFMTMARFFFDKPLARALSAACFFLAFIFLIRARSSALACLRISASLCWLHSSSCFKCRINSCSVWHLHASSTVFPLGIKSLRSHFPGHKWHNAYRVHGADIGTQTIAKQLLPRA